MQHVLGNKNSGVNALSRRKRALEDSVENENDADNYFEAKLRAIRHGFRLSSSSSFQVFDRKFLVRSSSITNNSNLIEFELFSLLFDRV